MAVTSFVVSMAEAYPARRPARRYRRGPLNGPREMRLFWTRFAVRARLAEYRCVRGRPPSSKHAFADIPASDLQSKAKSTDTCITNDDRGPLAANRGNSENVAHGRPGRRVVLLAQVTIATGFDVDYYLDQVGADYYLTAAGEPPGVWMGTAAEAMGLRGEVDPDVMRRLYHEGVAPDG